MQRKRKTKSKRKVSCRRVRKGGQVTLRRVGSYKGKDLYQRTSRKRR